MIRIREGTSADLKRVCQIKIRSWADTYRLLLPPATLRPFLDPDIQLKELGREIGRPDALLLVAVDKDDTVIAFALTFSAAEPEPWLESLHVAGDSRGRGIGTRLMRATARSLREGGHNTMRLGVVSGNDAAARLYARLGGLLEGTEPASWADGITHLIYRWSDLGSLAENSASAASD